MINLRTAIRVGYIVLLTTIGCGQQDDGRVKVYPVSGQVLVGGEPAEGARVVFYSTSPDLQGPGLPTPAGITDENGVFHLRSFELEDGAPAGDYNISVLWIEPPPPGVSEEDESYQPKDRLRGRYGDPKQSGLTATVEEGGGEVPPFELQ